jgi:alpha-beta hydrolase superfamily lysophospholipase
MQKKKKSAEKIIKEIKRNTRRKFSAEHEQIVSLKAHKIFIEEATKYGKNCKAFLIENAQHELLMEKDDQRIETLNNILSYFNSHR